MDFLKGKQILYDNTLKLAETLLNKKSLILYYFTAGDCDACRHFDLKLNRVCAEAEKRNIEIAVVVVCSDTERAVFMETIETNYSDWYAVPFDDELSPILMYNYGVTHIPSVIVVKENGNVITREGRSDIEKIGINVLVTWL